MKNKLIQIVSGKKARWKKNEKNKIILKPKKDLYWNDKTAVKCNRISPKNGSYTASNLLHFAW